MHRERASKLISDLEGLASQGVALSPFLEIGAGSVQRSLALTHHFGANGVAVDISQGSLRDAPFVLSLLGYKRMPLRICCDAHHLPFSADTFQFVFAYQTLHHFDNPDPVVAECHRVLGDSGCFFFNEEPIDSPLRRLLRGRRMLSHPPTRIQQLAYRAGVEKLFWDDGAIERSLGITEARFDVDTWREVLARFSPNTTVQVNRRLRIWSDLQTSSVGSLLARTLGGNAMGICRKTGGERVSGRLHDRLVCVDCGAPIPSWEEGILLCMQCGRQYPFTEGILRMLPIGLENQLYG
jgi:SAM-dependent methyltransferase